MQDQAPVPKVTAAATPYFCFGHLWYHDTTFQNNNLVLGDSKTFWAWIDEVASHSPGETEQNQFFSYSGQLC